MCADEMIDRVVPKSAEIGGGVYPRSDSDSDLTAKWTGSTREANAVSFGCESK
jgi:hypothetical protein